MAKTPIDGARRMKRGEFEKALAELRVELVNMLDWIRKSGHKLVVVFEGRDAAGKGGTIKRIVDPLNPRYCRVVALPAPTERERTQWYFQRYVPHLPAAGEMVVFDRSWYNRAGVERVMGFCTDAEYWDFLRTAPDFERMQIRSGTQLIKYWFSVSDEEQERRFAKRLIRPGATVETLRNGSRVPQALVGLLQGQGPDDRVHVHPGLALVGGGRGRQASGAAELHHSPARTGALRAGAARRAGASPAPGGPGLPAPSGREDQL